MILRNILSKMILLIAAGLLAGCNPPPPPTASEITVQPSKTIEIGKTATLDLTAEGTGLQFEWTVERGTLSNRSQAAVVYTAPDTPGLDLVTVTVKTKGGEIVRNMTFEVVEPTPEPTATLPPTPVDTQMPTEPPRACDTRTTTQNLFPQLFKEFGMDGQFPTYGPVEGAGAENFHCEVVSNPDSDPNSDHKPSQTVHIAYEKVTDNFGWWGVSTPSGYDASQHNQFCFWAYAQQPKQSFRVKMKDTSMKEGGPAVVLETANQWKQICTNISAFQELGVNTQQMDNVNLGFEAPLGSAEIWIAEFEFQ